jgi:hypothetical protein
MNLKSTRSAYLLYNGLVAKHVIARAGSGKLDRWRMLNDPFGNDRSDASASVPYFRTGTRAPVGLPGDSGLAALRVPCVLPSARTRCFLVFVDDDDLKGAGVSRQDIVLAVHGQKPEDQDLVVAIVGGLLAVRIYKVGSPGKGAVESFPFVTGFRLGDDSRCTIEGVIRCVFKRSDDSRPLPNLRPGIKQFPLVIQCTNPACRDSSVRRVRGTTIRR